MFKNIRDKAKKHIEELISVNTTPHSIASGFAIGTLIGILPTPGISMPIALLIVFIFPKINKISLVGAILFWNPLLTIPLYPPSYALGNMIFGNTEVIRYNLVLFDQAYNFTRRFLVGNAIIAITIAMTSYLITRIVIIGYKKNR